MFMNKWRKSQNRTNKWLMVASKKVIDRATHPRALTWFRKKERNGFICNRNNTITVTKNERILRQPHFRHCSFSIDRYFETTILSYFYKYIFGSDLILIVYLKYLLKLSQNAISIFKYVLLMYIFRKAESSNRFSIFIHY